MKAKKTKHPKTVWVGFDRDEQPLYVSRIEGEVLCVGSRKRYHLSPGNEVARALNVLDKYGYLMREVTDTMIPTLRKAGFPIRWEAKKGRFV